MKHIILFLIVISNNLFSINYQYDTNNRLVRVADDNGTTKQYTYDKLGNRTSENIYKLGIEYAPSNIIAGTVITFNLVATGEEIPASSSYTWAFGDNGTGTGLTATHAYTANGTYTVACTVTYTDGTKQTVTREIKCPSSNQMLKMNEGWNLISFNTNINGSTIESVFPNLIADNNYVAMKNRVNLFDFPVFNIHDIPSLTYTQAYHVYLEKADSVAVGGTSVSPESTPIALTAGWNTIPYLRNSPMSAATALATILPYIKLLQNQAGGQFIPSENVNTLEQGTSNSGMLVPGKGYAIYVTQACTLTYPANSEYVTIGTQRWATRNLDVATYRNGDPIPQVTDPTAWANLTTGAWCYYNNDPANGAIYGKLYNWYAVNDSRGLAPEGWHVPSDAEWTTLTTFLGGTSVAGGKLKETGTTHWNSPNTGATNETGFTALPGGYRPGTGIFADNGYSCTLWSSSANGNNLAWQMQLLSNGNSFNRGSNYKNLGFSVRLIKD